MKSVKEKKKEKEIKENLNMYNQLSDANIYVEEKNKSIDLGLSRYILIFIIGIVIFFVLEVFKYITHISTPIFSVCILVLVIVWLCCVLLSFIKSVK